MELLVNMKQTGESVTAWYENIIDKIDVTEN